MKCNLCTKKATIHSSKGNLHLCGDCFIKDFEKKVKITIKKYNLIKKREKVLVACSVSGETPLLIKHRQKIKVSNIEDVFELLKKEKNIRVLSLNRNLNIQFKKIKMAFKHKTNQLFNIQYDGGHLQTTKSHSVFIFDGDKVVPKKVEELSEGDYLITFLSGDNKIGKPLFLNKKDYIKDSKRVFNPITSKLKLCSELMRLFGYYVSEGHTTIKKREKSRSWEVGFTFNRFEKKQINETISFIKKYFNVQPKQVFHRHQSTTNIIYSNKELSQLFMNLFGHRATEKHIPSFFFSLPNDYIIEFLRGYSGDSFTTKKDVGIGTITFKTRSIKLSNELTFLLRLNKIACTFTKEFDKGHFSSQKTWIKGGWNYMISIPSQHNPFFNKKFSHKAPSSSCDRIPMQPLKNIYKEFKIKDLSHNMYDRIRTNKSINKQDCLQLVKRLQTYKNLSPKIKSKLNNIAKMASSHLAIAKIRKIQKNKFNGYVYDLSVPDSEAFFGGNAPILLHNSGGKDSTVALYLLHKFGYNVEGLIVDLEIGNYSKTNLDNIKNFCKEHNIKLHEASFREDFGYSKCKLERELKKKGVALNSCSICGVLRRYMLNKKSREMGFDKIVTGHNLDDEAQAILMNFFRNTMQLQARLGPVSGNVKDNMFTPRIKPLYFCLENDIRKYSKILGFEVLYDRCPCIIDSYRNKVRDIINEMKDCEDIKKNIVNNFLKVLPKLKKKYSREGEILSCKECSEPSSDSVCTTCKIIANLK